MQQRTPSKDALVLHYLTLRKAVGWLGVALPAAMVLGNLVLKGCTHFQDTISHYYHTVTGDLFVGLLSGVALFLLSYKGYDRTDHITTSLAGVFAFLIALFPTYNNSTDSCALHSLQPGRISHLVHYASAAAFFILLAYISLFQFTKSRGTMSPEKKIRNRIYRVCGILIFVCIALIAVYKLGEAQFTALAPYKPVFWLEWIALLAFGMSWLVKGELILQDAG